MTDRYLPLVTRPHPYESRHTGGTGLCWKCGRQPGDVLHAEHAGVDVVDGRLRIRRTAVSPAGTVSLDVNVTAPASPGEWLRVAELLAAMRELSRSLGGDRRG